MTAHQGDRGGVNGDGVAATVGEVVDLFVEFGSQNYDELVSQLDHARQTAALAEASGADDHLVAAALLHDVGHLLELRAGGRPDGAVEVDLDHEHRGARWLSAVFSEAVTGPIAGHVAAKRYLAAVDPALVDRLSDGSRASLARQGGPMTPDEVAAFEADPNHREAVDLRRWDDAGKVTGLVVPPFDHFVPTLDRARRP